MDTNTALILATLIASVFTSIDTRRKYSKVSKEVRSPNGDTTGATVYQIATDISELKSSVIAVRTEQRKVAAALRLTPLHKHGDD